MAVSSAPGPGFSQSVRKVYFDPPMQAVWKDRGFPSNVPQAAASRRQATRTGATGSALAASRIRQVRCKRL